jgi:hypothetical protein
MSISNGPKIEAPYGCAQRHRAHAIPKLPMVVAIRLSIIAAPLIVRTNSQTGPDPERRLESVRANDCETELSAPAIHFPQKCGSAAPDLLEPIREVAIHVEYVVRGRRRSMMRIMASLTKAATVRAYRSKSRAKRRFCKTTQHTARRGRLSGDRSIQSFLHDPRRLPRPGRRIALSSAQRDCKKTQSPLRQPGLLPITPIAGCVRRISCFGCALSIRTEREGEPRLQLRYRRVQAGQSR